MWEGIDGARTRDAGRWVYLGEEGGEQAGAPQGKQVAVKVETEEI